ncbi:MAG: PqqD family protein [Bacteroidaceae bacterium]|nr:PqqD family protein [Bacteroidaceae bacterium]
MKIKDGFELRNICGENIIVSHGIENIDFVKVISLNESAAVVWNKVMGKEFTIDDMVSALMSEYDVDAETAKADCQTLIDDWKRIGFLA